MSLIHFSLLLFLALSPYTTTTSSSHSQPTSSPYLSPTILFKNYQNMLKSFKVFAYTPAKPFSYNSIPESLFYSSLLNSPFLTQDPEEAHLYVVPVPPDYSTRSHARLVSEIRTNFPYWNRTLGADHFFISCSGLSFVPDRNVLELKKNSVMVSCFPAQPGNFIPHKDITLPPFANAHAPPNVLEKGTHNYLGYVRYNWVRESSLVNELIGDRVFLVESEPSDQRTYEERLVSSKYCLFKYDAGDISAIGEALRFGCVPVMITDRPIQDLPLMDVLTWQDIAMFVGSTRRVGEIESALTRTSTERYVEMKRLGVTAGQHFLWNESPQPHDAFHMVMYQLWLRRHTIRYTLRDWE